MTVQAPWRDLRSMIVVTFLVAVVACMIRPLGRPACLEGSMAVWLPITIAVAGFACWPIGQKIASSMTPADDFPIRACPRCHRSDVRPLVRAGSGLFHPTTRYRCAACWTVYQSEDGTAIVESVWSQDQTLGTTGIEFLDSASRDEMCYLDEPSKSPE